jgi:hypothetical protein
MIRHVACVGEMKSTYKILIVKAERKKTFKRPKHINVRKMLELILVL